MSGSERCFLQSGVAGGRPAGPGGGYRPPQGTAGGGDGAGPARPAGRRCLGLSSAPLSPGAQLCRAAVLVRLSRALCRVGRFSEMATAAPSLPGLSSELSVRPPHRGTPRPRGHLPQKTSPGVVLERGPDSPQGPSAAAPLGDKRPQGRPGPSATLLGPSAGDARHRRCCRDISLLCLGVKKGISTWW